MKRRLIIRLSTGLVCMACIAGLATHADADYEHLNTINYPIKIDSWPIFNGRASQGIAENEGTFYTTRGGFLGSQTLFKYDQYWNVERSVDIDYDPWYDNWIKHVGDITTDDDFVYVPVSDGDMYKEKGHPTRANIARYSLDDLTYDADWTKDIYQDYDFGFGYDFENDDSGDITAGLDFYDGYLYGVEWEGSEDAYILNFTNEDAYKIESRYANGIDIYGNEYGAYAYLSCGDESGDAKGIIDVYDLDSLQEGNIVNSPIMKYTYDTPEIHAEGLTFDGTDLWVAQDHYVQQIETPFLPGDHILYGSPIEDQSQKNPGGGWNVYSQRYFAQTFTCGNSGQLSDVDLLLTTFSGESPDYPSTFSIVNVVGGIPDGSVIGSVYTSGFSLGWNTIDFLSEGVFLNKDTQYAILVSNDDPDPLYIAPTLGLGLDYNNDYSGGMMWWYSVPSSSWSNDFGTQWSIAGGTDGVFVTRMARIVPVPGALILAATGLLSSTLGLKRLRRKR